MLNICSILLCHINLQSCWSTTGRLRNNPFPPCSVSSCSVCAAKVHSCPCVYSNSRNDVPQVAQRYGTIAVYTRRRASVLVFVVFCVHMYSFAGLIRWTPPPTFSDTTITDRHSDTTIFQLRAHWVRISWSIGLEKSFGHVPPVGVEPSTSWVQGEHPIH